MPEQETPMITLSDIFEVSAVLEDYGLDVSLRALIGFRAWHMVVEAFAIIGPDAETPSFLSVEDHGQWFELAYAKDDAPHIRIFIEVHADTDNDLLTLCFANM